MAINKLADAYDDLMTSYNQLMELLGGKPAPNPPATAPIKPTTQQFSGYSRMTATPNQDLQNIAQQILNKYRNEPFGFKVPFTYNGKNYLGVIEQHIGGRVAGPHPGVSLFEQSGASQQSPSSNYKPSANIDQRNQQIISGLNPRLKAPVERLLQEAQAQGINLVLTAGFRSNAEQERLYQQGRTTKGRIVTHVGPGNSKHNYGAAVDVAFVNDKGQPYWPNNPALWQKVGRIGESLGLRWGGNWKGFKDMPHFELPVSIAQLRSQAADNSLLKKADPEYMRNYMRNRYHSTRQRLVDQLGGKCARCGSTKDLQFDHIDASKKNFRMSDAHSVSDERVQDELKNVQLLCKKCHDDKTRDEWDFGGPKPRHGTYWMYRKYGCRCPKCVKAYKEKYNVKSERFDALKKLARRRGT